MTNNLLNKSRKIFILLILFSAFILFPSFLLLMGSSWSNDDYGLAKLFQSSGLQGLSSRVFYASPRFLSEAVLYIYYYLVYFLKKPFTGLFILTLWLSLILFLFINFKTIIHQFSRLLTDHQNSQKNEEILNNKISRIDQLIDLKLLVSLLLSLILFGYFIYVERPVTMYYAPAVAAPYILTLSAIILSINFLLTKADNTNVSWLEFLYFTVISLMVSASWEIGAVYQLILNICLFLILLLTNFKFLSNYLPFSLINLLSKIKLAIAIILSSALSLYVIFLIKTYRVGFVEVNSSLESSSIGNWNNSLIQSLTRFGKEILFLNSPAWEVTNSWWDLSYSLVCKLGLLLIILLILSRLEINISQRVQNICFISLIPLLATNFVTIITSYYQFGEICCDRQLSFRGALFGLTIFIISFLLSSKINYLLNNIDNVLEQKKVNKIFTLIQKTLTNNFTLIIVFCLTFTLLINSQFNHLKPDFVNLNKIIQANNLNWQESQDPNKSYAIHRQILTSYMYRFNLEEGIYPSCTSSQNILALLYMKYFEKEEFYVLPVDKNISYLTNNNKYDDRYLASINNSENIRFICQYSQGSVDMINDSTQTGSVITVSKDKSLEIQGWAVKPDKTEANNVLITMGNENKIMEKIPVNQSRLDVAKFLKSPNLVNSGWSGNLTPPFSKEQENPVIFRAWAYDAEKKSAYLFREFYLQFDE